MRCKKFPLIVVFEIISGIDMSNDPEKIKEIIDFTTPLISSNENCERFEICRKILLDQYPQFSSKKMKKYIATLKRKLSKRKKNITSSEIIDRWMKKQITISGKYLKVRKN